MKEEAQNPYRIMDLWKSNYLASNRTINKSFVHQNPLSFIGKQFPFRINQFGIYRHEHKSIKSAAYSVARSETIDYLVNRIEWFR